MSALIMWLTKQYDCQQGQDLWHQKSHLPRKATEVGRGFAVDVACIAIENVGSGCVNLSKVDAKDHSGVDAVSLFRVDAENIFGVDAGNVSGVEVSTRILGPLSVGFCGLCRPD